MPAPRGYSVAITRVPLTGTPGVYRLTARKGERIGIVGTPVLNVVDGALRSVTVYRDGLKPLRIPAARVTGLFFGTAADALTFSALTR